MMIRQIQADEALTKVNLEKKLVLKINLLSPIEQL